MGLSTLFKLISGLLKPNGGSEPENSGHEHEEACWSFTPQK